MNGRFFPKSQASKDHWRKSFWGWRLPTDHLVADYSQQDYEAVASTLKTKNLMDALAERYGNEEDERTE